MDFENKSLDQPFQSKFDSNAKKEDKRLIFKFSIFMKKGLYFV